MKVQIVLKQNVQYISCGRWITAIWGLVFYGWEEAFGSIWFAVFAGDGRIADKAILIIHMGEKV